MSIEAKKSNGSNFGEFADICAKKSNNIITGAEAWALYDLYCDTSAVAGMDADNSGLLALEVLDDLINCANDFFIHPTEFRSLQRSQKAHHDWITEKKLTGTLIPMGVAAMANPFYTEYLTDVCQLGPADASTELIKLHIENRNTLEFTDLMSPDCSHGNVQKANEHIEKWWTNLQNDGLDSSQIVRTLCGEKRKNPEGTLLIGDIAMRLVREEVDVVTEIDKLRENAPTDQTSGDEILEWVGRVSKLNGVRDLINRLAKELE